MSVDRLLDPASVAVVGASADADKIGHAAMANATRFDGPVYPVNPNAEELFGRTCYRSVESIEGEVDLALLCVPPAVLPDVIEECGTAGVGGAVIYAAGFSELSEEGQRHEAELVSLARQHGLALLGPNTSGFLNVNRGVYASFVTNVDEIPAGAVSVVAQSGGINHVLVFMAAQESVGIAKAVGLGNAADVGFSDVIRHLDGDDATGSIILHVEGLEDARDVLQTCRAVETPVVMYKVGREDVSDFAASHTGALIGDYDLYRSVCAGHGVPVVESCQELVDAGVVLADLPPPGGSNVALITGQAGPGIAITDRLEAAGATLPDLSEATRETVADCLPGLTYTSNPIDTGQPPDSETYDRLLGTVAGDDAVDILLVYQLYEDRIDYPVDTLKRVVEETGVPVVFGTNGPAGPVRAGLESFRTHGIPAYRSPERAADAVGTLVEYARTNVEAER